MTDTRPVSVERAAEWLGVSARTVRREIADGRLPAAKVRGIIRILPADLSAYFERQKAACRSGDTETAGKSGYELVVAAALSGLSPLAPPAGMRKRSNLRSVGRWATLIEQANNRRDTTWVEWRGRRLTLRDLSEATGINLPALQSRYQRGKRGDALIAPLQRRPAHAAIPD